MNKITLLIVSTIISIHVQSQTGPGGVGTNDGTSSLVLWLDANTETTGVDGTALPVWHDNSGNGLDFPAGTAISGDGATFNSSGVNGYPSLTFNGSTDYYEHPYSAALNPGNVTVFSASNVVSTGTYKSLITSRSSIGGDRRGYILYSRPTSNVWDFWTAQGPNWGNNASVTSTAGSWASVICEYAPGTSNKKMFINQNLGVTATRSMQLNVSAPTRIGTGHTTAIPDYYFQGEMAEIMIYDVILNSAQKIIIDNYMSAKYNYALTANDFYDEDDAGNGNYDHDVAGIGRIDASNMHNDSQGTGIVRILNPTGLSDNEFLFWGHDNGMFQAVETTDVPSPVVARFERVWRVSEVNASNTAIDVGNIDMRFDLTGLGPVTASDLRLLIDLDNDGTFADETIGGGIISGATSLGGNVYAFTGVTNIANNVRFTLGSINTAQTPLPIELIDFSAKQVDNKYVQFDWQTSSETNNDYFTIERSENGQEWIEIKDIQGAGNSSSLLRYSTVDSKPVSGISYYRLKQTDFDGQFEYSEIRSVEIKNREIHLYPNPTERQMVITGDKRELEGLGLYDVLGQDVTVLIKYIQRGESILIIDLSDLSDGTYYLKTKTTTNKVHKQ